MPRAACAALLGLLAAGPAWAQATRPAAQVPQGSPIPRLLPRTPPSVGAGPAPLPQAGPSGPVPNVSVLVRNVAVNGATAYPAARLAKLTAGLIGPAVKLARIEAARQAILDLYRRDGYLLTAVSASLDKAGDLRFSVTEGRVVAVKLQGHIGPAGTMVLRFLNHLTHERPVNIAGLERWLLLAQSVPGVTLRTVLRPSAAEPGALTLVAEVSRQAVSGLYTADNRGYVNTGPEEELGVFDLNSVTEFGDKTEVSLFHTFNNTQTFGQVASSFFVGDSGLRVRLYGGAGQATPSGQLRAIGYHGYTDVFGASATYPVIRRRQQTLDLTASFDALESEIDTASAVGGGNVRASFDSLRVARIGITYAREDVLLGANRSAVNVATLRFSHGLPILGATRDGDPQAGRLNERTDFWKLNAQISRTQTLFEPWQGATVALEGIVAGQVTSDVLPTAEEFYLGGSQYTRGFYAGEVTGDNALAGTVELQLNTGMQVHAFGRPYNIAAQFYGFYDYGETWQNQKLDPNHRVASAGGGVRFNLTRYAEVDLEGVARFTRRVDAGSPTVPALSPASFYWRVLLRF